MNTRREFLKRTTALVGAGGAFLSEAIERAFAIDPAPGSTWADAEHVVVLMQENRSFDHLYGTLRGVRGFGDPRAVTLPSGCPVWCQAYANGEAYAPFRLDLRNTRVTWLGSLPHSWTDQTDARNGGRHDGWLEAKRSGRAECRDLPFTMGAYTREDVGFYYDLADAFTVCDQHFCSSLTGTMPNRLFLWSGTIRGTHDRSGRARVNNSDVEYEDSCAWTTFPDRLEDLGISWKVYQNELSAVDVGLSTEEAAWLANYGDNPLEWFPQFHVGHASSHVARLRELAASLPDTIAGLRARLERNASSAEARQRLQDAEAELARVRDRLARFTPGAFARLPARERALHAKGLSTNAGDPDHRRLETLRYDDDGTERRFRVPKGDVLHAFRKDVASGQLPAISWIVAPENFSDHPSSAWYGAWYVSEVMNILTRNPDVWRKTVFLLTYDENDGYFDHVPPFVPPDPNRPGTGAVDAGIRAEEDYVSMAEELKTKDPAAAREGPVGLGFRVPMVIASPWSRGGYVCSQVFDHTSPLQFLERWLSARTGKRVAEENIGSWRRAVCGDLTSAFRPHDGSKVPLPPFLGRDPFVEGIHRAQFKPFPAGFAKLTAPELADARATGGRPARMIRQEPGTRPSCALPYDLAVDARLDAARGVLEVVFASHAGRRPGGGAGAPFNVQAPGLHASLDDPARRERCRSWNFAVASGGTLRHAWPLDGFEGGKAWLRVDGPNGFHREFRTHAGAGLSVRAEAIPGTTRLVLVLGNAGTGAARVTATDNAYGTAPRTARVAAGETVRLEYDFAASHGWHDLTVAVDGDPGVSFRHAGRLETGRDSLSDPAIGA